MYILIRYVNHIIEILMRIWCNQVYSMKIKEKGWWVSKDQYCNNQWIFKETNQHDQFHVQYIKNYKTNSDIFKGPWNLLIRTCNLDILWYQYHNNFVFMNQHLFSQYQVIFQNLSLNPNQIPKQSTTFYEGCMTDGTRTILPNRRMFIIC